MRSLADTTEIVGFFSYSREDDEDSNGTLSLLRERIQRELRGQLGKSAREFRLWQDKEAIAPGKLWRAEIEAAISQSAFIIPIVSPTTVRSEVCQIEFDLFHKRERELGRNDLIFPILYIRVPGLDDPIQRQTDPVLKMIAERQFVDWRALRHLDAYSLQCSQAIELLCSKIADALRASYETLEEREERRKSTEALRQSEIERQAWALREQRPPEPPKPVRSTDRHDAPNSKSASHVFENEATRQPDNPAKDKSSFKDLSAASKRERIWYVAVASTVITFLAVALAAKYL